MLSRAMEGIRVLDLSRILAGPWCTQNLADLGADVIKVENPSGGDDTRGWGPPYLDGPGGDSKDRMSAYFLCCNRGKRSIAVNFADQEGAAIVRHLAAKADILVENFKSGSLAKYGLDAQSLCAENPRLIYLSITGFGQDGPMAGKPGYDYVFQGYGGLMSYTGRSDGEPGSGPLRAGASVIDLNTGMYATMAVLGALLDRSRTGTGQHIDLALSDVAVALNANQNMNYLVSGKVPGRVGNTHPNLAPYEVFECRDGHLILAIGNDSQFERFCAQVGRGELSSDSRFDTNAARLQHRAVLREIVANLMRERSQDEWRALLDGAGIPWGPINTLDRVFAEPQVRHRKMEQTLAHDRLGAVPTVRNPVSYTDISQSRPPPLLGEHTQEVLEELDLSHDQIERLMSRHVVGVC